MANNPSEAAQPDRYPIGDDTDCRLSLKRDYHHTNHNREDNTSLTNRRPFSLTLLVHHYSLFIDDKTWSTYATAHYEVDYFQ